eukprot:UN03345
MYGNNSNRKNRLENISGCKLNYPIIYQSLTTPAVDHEKDMNYNRCEFMGDSILLWVIAKIFFNIHPEASPVELTAHVNKRIANEFLAEHLKKPLTYKNI